MININIDPTISEYKETYLNYFDTIMKKEIYLKVDKDNIEETRLILEKRFITFPKTLEILIRVKSS